MQSSELPNITVPEHLLMFSAALRPCLAKLEKTLSAMSRPHFASVDGMDTAEDILEQAGLSCGNMEGLIETMMDKIISNPNVSSETVYRHVGRFEGNLDILLKAGEKSLYSDCYGYPEAKRLLIGGMAKILEQIRDWLENICDTIDYPLDAYQKRAHDIEDGSAVFSFSLKLETPAEFTELNRLAKSIVQKQPAHSGHRFWSSLGSIILGFAFVDWLFDDD